MGAALLPPAGFVSLSDGYSRQERVQIAAQLNAGAQVVCPRCGAPLTVSPVAPPPSVSYVRKRALAVCSACHRSVAVDVSRRPSNS